ncbi:MAG: hypothetical protein ACYC1U_07740, partial [Candidatus Aquicultorales bacterium]
FPPVVAMLIAARPREWRRTVPAALAGLTAGVAASGLLGGDLSGLSMTFAPGRFLAFAGERFTKILAATPRTVYDGSTDLIRYALIGSALALPVGMGARLLGLGMVFKRRRENRAAARAILAGVAAGFLPLFFIWIESSRGDVYQTIALPLFLLWYPVAGWLTDPRTRRSLSCFPVAALICLQLVGGVLPFRTSTWVEIAPKNVDRYLELKRVSRPSAVVIATDFEPYPSPVTYIAERRTILSNVERAGKYSRGADLEWRAGLAKIGVKGLYAEKWPRDWKEVWYVPPEDDPRGTDPILIAR